MNQKDSTNEFTVRYHRVLYSTEQVTC